MFRRICIMISFLYFIRYVYTLGCILYIMAVKHLEAEFNKYETHTIHSAIENHLAGFSDVIAM